MTDTSKFPLTGTQAFIDECARSQPKYKRVDLENMRCMGVFTSNLGSNFTRGYNAAIDDIKSKYGDLYVEVK